MQLLALLTYALLPLLGPTLAIPMLHPRAATAATCASLATAAEDIASGIALLNAAVKGGNVAVAPDVTQAETAQSQLQTVISGAGCIAKREISVKREVERAFEKRQLGDVIESVIRILDVIITDVGSVPEAQEEFKSADSVLLPLLPLFP